MARARKSNEDLIGQEPGPESRTPRAPPVYPGDMPKTCANCQHFKPKVAGGRDGRCHNGISGKFVSRAIDGCAYGFYPSIEKFPLKAGPGGTR